MDATSMSVKCSPVTAGHVPRRFKLLDAMVLVAATALGCGMTLWIGRETGAVISWVDVWAGSSRPIPSWGDGGAAILERAIESSLFLALLSVPFMAMLTLAMIPIRLFRPRPSLRHLLRQPGTMASCAFPVAILTIALVLSGPLYLVGIDLVDFGLEIVLFLVPAAIGLAVLVSWLTLLATGRWRGERTWVDRLGRALGIYWIIVGLSLPSLMILQSFGHQTCGFVARPVEEKLIPAATPPEPE